MSEPTTGRSRGDSPPRGADDAKRRPGGSHALLPDPLPERSERITSVDGVERPGRVPVDVAVGVLVERDTAGREGRFLLTSRPEGKVYAGHWEFPGGKFEPLETLEQALRRELHEELGITIGAVHPWQQEVFDYPHALVRLHFCKVYEWAGEFEMREGQRMAWATLPVQVRPVLPGTLPVLRWFAEERGHAGPTHVE